MIYTHPVFAFSNIVYTKFINLIQDKAMVHQL